MSLPGSCRGRVLVRGWGLEPEGVCGGGGGGGGGGRAHGHGEVSGDGGVRVGRECVKGWHGQGG